MTEMRIFAYDELPTKQNYSMNNRKKIIILYWSGRCLLYFFCGNFFSQSSLLSVMCFQIIFSGLSLIHLSQLPELLRINSCHLS